MGIAVVTGNPKPGSRTLEAAVLVATKLGGSEPDVVVDVVDLGPGLLGWDDPDVTAAIAAVKASSAVVVASPTFKATYTGLLKLFLDQIPTNGLAGVVGIPMMLGGRPDHALAPELLLKPVLVELGATCPTKGLFMLDTEYADPAALQPWIDVAGPQVAGAIAGAAVREVVA
jgi:FMN reductase